MIQIPGKNKQKQPIKKFFSVTINFKSRKTCH